jgi:hypothetical protein
MSAAAPAAIEFAMVAVPQVTDAAALDDRAWFDARPNSRFRARPGDGGLWLIRRCPQGADPEVFLLTFSRAIATPTDRDGDVAAAWFGAAYPAWPTERVLRRARKALRP